MKSNETTSKLSLSTSRKLLELETLRHAPLLSNILLYVMSLSENEDVKTKLKDVRAHCYCAYLVRTLYMTWRVLRHVFQARAPSRNSTKYRADDLCCNLICEYFCWMLGDPHFFFGRSLSLLILSIILKNKKNQYVGSFNYFSYTIQIESNWYIQGYRCARLRSCLF